MPLTRANGTHALRHLYASVLPNASESSILTGPLALGRDVTIGANAQLVGPTIIGHGTAIGAGAAVVRRVVLPGAAVSDGTLAANAVIADPRRSSPNSLFTGSDRRYVAGASRGPASFGDRSAGRPPICCGAG